MDESLGFVDEPRSKTPAADSISRFIYETMLCQYGELPKSTWFGDKLLLNEFQSASTVVGLDNSIQLLFELKRLKEHVWHLQT